MASDWGGDDGDKRCFEGKNGGLGNLMNIKEEEGEAKNKNDKLLNLKKWWYQGGKMGKWGAGLILWDKMMHFVEFEGTTGYLSRTVQQYFVNAAQAD